MGFAIDYKRRLHTALDKISLEAVEDLIDVFRKARAEDRQIFVFGNGGSAATANHFACDMVKGASFGRSQRFKILSLAEQIPTLTAYSNDVGYESVFVEHLKNFARPGDVVMGISGSGDSENVIQAIDYGNSIGCFSVGLSGFNGGRLRPMVDLSVHVPDGHMGRVEDAHFVVCHMVCYHFMDTESGGNGTADAPSLPA
ncbi:MAG: SIS domain-containing protein [Bryobacterales bacterium]|nr:SIS domain-containing protein [Bryobacterales bacterium]